MIFQGPQYRCLDDFFFMINVPLPIGPHKRIDISVVIDDARWGIAFGIDPATGSYAGCGEGIFRQDVASDAITWVDPDLVFWGRRFVHDLTALARRMVAMDWGKRHRNLKPLHLEGTITQSVLDRVLTALHDINARGPGIYQLVRSEHAKTG